MYKVTNEAGINLFEDLKEAVAFCWDHFGGQVVDTKTGEIVHEWESAWQELLDEVEGWEKESL